MPEPDDHQLLAQFAREHSEPAFTALVQRHLNLVYSAARRHTGSDHAAEEITQAVFIILARKAVGLSPRIVLSGWLWQTVRLTAANHLRAESRRVRREQEAYMQSQINEPATDPAWQTIAPLLDDALDQLGGRDRDALVLRFFEHKNLREVGHALGASEDAAKMRVNRALEKLRKFFSRRGIVLSAALIAGAVSANSVQAAPAGLAKTISLLALTHGATAGTSTLTLVKGASKIMAWTNAKSAVVAGLGILLVIGSTTVVMQEHRPYSWQVPKFGKYPNTSVAFSDVWAKTPPQVRIVPSIYTNFTGDLASDGSGAYLASDGTAVETNRGYQAIGLGEPLENIVNCAYAANPVRTIYLTKIPPKPLYDYISNFSHQTAQPLQDLLRQKFGIVGRRELRDTDVLLLKFSNTKVQGIKPALSLVRSMNITNVDPFDLLHGFVRGDAYFDQTMDHFIAWYGFEDTFQLPVIDGTEITNRFDCVIKWPEWNPRWNNHPEERKQAVASALYDQLGLELVPTNLPVEMLVIEKIK